MRILAIAAIGAALAGCASSRSMNETLLEVPSPDILGGKTFQYENDGPETVAMHAKTGVLCRVPARAACAVSWDGKQYVVRETGPAR
jgi:hypothetical protein